MYLLTVLFAFSALLENANRFLLPCPFKYLTGYDCPGCGFQRSVLALLNGNFHESFQLYPPAIPILVTIAVSIAVNKWLPSRSKPVINTLFIITGSIILISYGIKIFTPHLHTASLILLPSTSVTKLLS
jgi:hypothetical protein